LKKGILQINCQRGQIHSLPIQFLIHPFRLSPLPFRLQRRGHLVQSSCHGEVCEGRLCRGRGRRSPSKPKRDRGLHTQGSSARRGFGSDFGPSFVALPLSRSSLSRMVRHPVHIPWLTFFSEPFSKVSLMVCLHLEQTVITTPSTGDQSNLSVLQFPCRECTHRPVSALEHRSAISLRRGPHLNLCIHTRALRPKESLDEWPDKGE